MCGGCTWDTSVNVKGGGKCVKGGAKGRRLLAAEAEEEWATEAHTNLEEVMEEMEETVQQTEHELKKALVVGDTCTVGSALNTGLCCNLHGASAKTAKGTGTVMKGKQMMTRRWCKTPVKPVVKKTTAPTAAKTSAPTTAKTSAPTAAKKTTPTIPSKLLINPKTGNKIKVHFGEYRKNIKGRTCNGKTVVKSSVGNKAFTPKECAAACTGQGKSCTGFMFYAKEGADRFCWLCANSKDGTTLRKSVLNLDSMYYNRFMNGAWVKTTKSWLTTPATTPALKPVKTHKPTAKKVPLPPPPPAKTPSKKNDALASALKKKVAGMKPCPGTVKLSNKGCPFKKSECNCGGCGWDSSYKGGGKCVNAAATNVAKKAVVLKNPSALKNKLGAALKAKVTEANATAAEANATAAEEAPAVEIDFPKQLEVTVAQHREIVQKIGDVVAASAEGLVDGVAPKGDIDPAAVREAVKVAQADENAIKCRTSHLPEGTMYEGLTVDKESTSTVVQDPEGKRKQVSLLPEMDLDLIKKILTKMMVAITQDEKTKCTNLRIEQLSEITYKVDVDFYVILYGEPAEIKLSTEYEMGTFMEEMKRKIIAKIAEKFEALCVKLKVSEGYMELGREIKAGIGAYAEAHGTAGWSRTSRR
jgi:hypothetical protein